MSVCLIDEVAGKVVDVSGGKVEVLFNTAQGPQQQTFLRSQFLDGRMPKVGDDLTAVLTVMDYKKPKMYESVTEPIEVGTEEQGSCKHEIIEQKHNGSFGYKECTSCGQITY